MEKTVWVVARDERKNMTEARKFGDLIAVFATKPFYDDPSKLLEHARKVLSGWRDGDCLLMIGDPTLCAICAAVATEYADDGIINILRYDRIKMDYINLKFDFDNNFNN